jgi:hypothetical protein
MSKVGYDFDKVAGPVDQGDGSIASSRICSALAARVKAVSFGA